MAKNHRDDQPDLFQQPPTTASGYVSRIFGGGERFGGSGLPPDFHEGLRSAHQSGAKAPAAPRPPSGPPPFVYHATGLERVWAGRNPLSGNDVRKLAGIGITHVLDLREDAEWLPPRSGEAAVELLEKKGIERLSLPIPDATAPSATQLQQAVDYLTAVLSVPEQKAYVHCRAGRGRTGAILLALALKKPGATLTLAGRSLQQTYPLFQPLGHQVDAVRAWAKPFLQEQVTEQLAAAGKGDAQITGKSLACELCNVVFDVHPAVLVFSCRECLRELGGSVERGRRN